MSNLKRVRFTGLVALTFLTLALGMLALVQNEPAAATDGLAVEEVHGAPVAPGVSLWVHVYRQPRFVGPPSSSPGTCDNKNENDDFDTFAMAKHDGVAFELNENQLASLAPGALGAIEAALNVWNGVQGVGSYFSSDPNEDNEVGPQKDGHNIVGALNIVPPSTLAATWSWVDDLTGEIVETDVFFNTRHDWEVFSECNAGATAFDIEAIAVHEFGHSGALNHVSNAYATMAPSAAPGELRKRTLTPGDEEGFRTTLGLEAAAPVGGGGDDGGGSSWCDNHVGHPKYDERCGAEGEAGPGQGPPASAAAASAGRPR